MVERGKDQIIGVIIFGSVFIYKNNQTKILLKKNETESKLVLGSVILS